MPVWLDYRGRLYCITEYLNYQGIELAKFLLEFNYGEKVLLGDDNSINYFKYTVIIIMVKDSLEIKKQSFNTRVTRVNWVNENIDNILDFENGILI
jgi:DNA-directed RNA polymerase